MTATGRRMEVSVKEAIEAVPSARPIPEGFFYAGVPGLSREVVEKCTRKRPRTIGEAARLPGVTPAAIAIISAHVARSGAPAAAAPTA